MAWSWSHSSEAYADARENVMDLPREKLEIIYAEWHAQEARGDDDSFSRRRYDIALKRAKTISEENLAEFIWEQMEELRTCTNGGHLAHCCPYGCLGHMVPFNRKQDEENEIPAQPE